MMKLLKRFFKKVKETANKAYRKVASLFTQTRRVLANQTGEGYVDTGVKILIAVVIGALLLAGLYALFNSTIMPTVTTKVQGLFNYSGK